MAGAVAGLLTSGLVGIAKNKLRSAIAEQASLLGTFGNDLREMEDHFETISAVLLDAERQSVKGELVRLWLKRLKDAAIDISEMLEDYKNMSDQANETMPGVLSCLQMAIMKIVMANRMKSLREKLSKIRNKFDSFNFVKGSSITHEQPCSERETTSSVPQEPVIGRDREKQEIINMLSDNTSNNGMVIVPIYGLGGMGKTTLAQLVYNDGQFKQYDHRVWVYVSQDFNLNKIGSSIISQLQPHGGQQNMCIQQVINQCLENLLSGKKVLVVLDDLWEERMAELDKLRTMLNIKDSKVDVIVTTRKENIARKVCTSEPYKLQTLEDHKCWEIIKRYSKFELKSDQARMGQIGLDIAQKCGGVALAAQAVGFMLRSIDDLSGWKEINNSDIWNGSSEDCDVLPSLRLSYERMPPQLRICFSYCAIFPKGHNIIEDELVQQWIALDFIEQSKGKEYIKQLLGMSFLQVSMLPSTSQEEVVRYTMHDLVHDLARLAMDDELIDSTAQERNNTLGHKYCRYLLLNYDQTTKLASTSPSKIRALHFSDGGELDIQSGAFSFVNCLRALGLCECSGILFPASVGQLKQLRCLIAPRMQNESLPECITELSKLQYLNINGSSQISALPESIGKLGCLKYLYMSGCSGVSKLPESFGNLMSMVHLDMSGCSGIRALPDSITELSKLQYLNINGSSQICALPESIGMLGCLKYLYLSGCSGISNLPESLGDLKCVARLDMSGCSAISELPDSLGMLTNLQHLELSGCSSLHSIPESLCGLTQLQYLNLSSCGCLDWLPKAIGSLADLQYLNLSSCGQIRELPESLEKLRNLLHLDLSCCSRMQHLGRLRGLTTLQHLDMSYCSSIGFQDLSDVLANLTNLKHLSIINLIISGNEAYHSYVPDWIGCLTNLEHLDLSWNTGLECLAESIGNLNRLHTLDLTECSGLQSLPESIRALELKSLLLDGCSVQLMDHASSLLHYSKLLPFFRVRADDVNGRSCSNLHLLEDENVGELRIHFLENVRSHEEANKVKLFKKHNLFKLTLAWSNKREVQYLDDKDLLGQLVPPRGLHHMRLECYSSSTFPDWFMGISHHLTNLVSITLTNLPTCSSLPPLGQLPHLECLSLHSLDKVTKIDSTFCGGKGAFPRLVHFSISHMDALEEWNTKYSVDNGVEEFMFPMLHSLRIRWCKKLRLKPCPPIFHECYIELSDHVVSSLDKVDKIGNPFAPSRAIKLDLYMGDVYDQCQGGLMKLLHHFPGLQELSISRCILTSFPESIQHLTTLQVLSFAFCHLPTLLPESIRHLTSIHSLKLLCCEGISELPESLGELSSLKSLVLHSCESIKSLPACIQQLNNLQTLEISYCPELKKWCESEENKTKLAHISNVQIRDKIDD